MSEVVVEKKRRVNKHPLTPFGKAIKRALIDKNSNIRKMCLLLGVSSTTMSHWMRGDRLMNADIFNQVLMYFDGYAKAQTEMIVEYYYLTNHVAMHPATNIELYALINLKLKGSLAAYRAVEHIVNMSPESLDKFVTLMDTACKSTPSS